MPQGQDQGRNLLVLLAALVALWGILGWLDIARQAEAGITLDNRQSITAVAAESPAAKAGLLPGDQLISIAGVAADDVRAMAQLPRARVGDSRVFRVLREGEEHLAQVTYAARPESAQKKERTERLLGFAFLLFPLLALLRHNSHATRILALMGIGLSLAFLAGPHIGEASARGLTAAIASLFVMVGIAAMLHFLLVFPRRRALVESGTGRLLVYAPALLLWGLLAWRLLFLPASTDLLNSASRLFLGVVEGGYFLVALFLLLHNYSKTDRMLRQHLALNGMLWCTVIGLLPALIGLLAAVFSPDSHLPGQDYYFMSLLLIPLGWSRSASLSR
jgi:hypothetical protein